MTRLVKSSPAFSFIFIIWAVFWIDVILPGINFLGFGIHPRHISGLDGILWAPFIHANLSHLISNTIPLLVLPAIGSLSMTNASLLKLMVFGAVGSGIGTWLFGSPAIVVGASGVVFSLLGYLLARAFYAPSIKTITVSLLAIVLYGGAVMSLLTVLPTVSWAAHFWGFISGIIFASIHRR